VRRGAAELDQPADPRGRIRQHDGPKRLRERDPGLVVALDRLVDPDTRGDPQSPLRWTCKSTRELAEALTAAGHPVSDDTVGRLLREQDYRLQRTVKTLEGAQHPDRDAQFGYLNEQAKAHLVAGQPVVSVDTKKKELVGRYANGGCEWQPAGEPEQVNVHDFPDPKVGKAIPYGVYDLGRNSGWVSVGIDHDTAAFAVATLRRWWQQVGRAGYPQADRLLVCADAGGSNGYRVRAWKTELARLAAETGLAITVCHLPPGTSKWNRIEHRLFSAISMNWRGRPLTSHEVIVELIGATTTHTGLQVRAELDRGRYPLGVKVGDEELAAVPLARHQFHGEWNYTVHPSAEQAWPA
jgi:Rhodopirellula transposase DDE domain